MDDLDSRDQSNREGEADLSALDDDALSTEAKREALRDQRQRRRVRAALVNLLIFAAAGSMTVTISALVDQNVENVKAGLVALCAISGGAIYRLRTED